VQLWFNEEIEVPFASIAVLDENKHSITVENPEAVEADLKSVVLSLPELIPGQYTVEYRILSMDGHVVESKFNFTLKNSAHEK
jgi:methionine-rich copper-binding protein CopC